MRRQFVRVGISAVAIAISSVFFQNCSGGLKPLSGDSSSSSSTDRSGDPSTPGGGGGGSTPSPQYLKFPALNCANKASLEGATVLPNSEFIRGVGRISSANAVGYLDEQGRVFVGTAFPSGPIPKLIDPNHRYKWFGFEAFQYGHSTNKYFPSAGVFVRCGLSVDDKVRCLKDTDAESVEITELAGSTQALMVQGLICGLQTDGSIKCYDSQMKLLDVRTNEKFVVLSQLHVITESYKSYESRLLAILPGFTAESEFRREAHQPYTNSTSITFYSEFEAKLCDLRLRNNSVGSNRPTNYPGCAVSETGRVYCYRSHLVEGGNGRNVPAVTLKINGEFDGNLNTIDPDNRYLAVRVFNQANIACGITTDNRPRCFSLGYVNGLKAAASALSLSFSARSAFVIDRPQSVTHVVHDEYAIPKRASILRDGEILSWRRPSFDASRNTVNAPKNMDPQNRYKLITQTYAYELSVCGLTFQGALRCNHGVYDYLTDSVKDQMIDQDPGIIYRTFVRVPQAACGWTSTNDIRCWYQFGFGKKAQNIILGTVVGHFGQKFFLSNGDVVDPFLRQQPTRLRNGNTNMDVVFREPVGETGSFFRASDNLIYFFAEDGKAYPFEGDLEADLRGFSQMNPKLYFNRATQKCAGPLFSYLPAPQRGYVIKIAQNNCNRGNGSVIDPTWVLAGFNYAPSDQYNGSFIREDGNLFDGAGEGTERYFIAPQTPVVQ